MIIEAGTETENKSIPYKPKTRLIAKHVTSNRAAHSAIKEKYLYIYIIYLYNTYISNLMMMMMMMMPTNRANQVTNGNCMPTDILD